MFCQKCGTQNEDVARFCANCGETLDLGSSSNQTGAAAAAPAGADFAPQAEPVQENDPKKLIKIAVAAVVAVIVVVLGFNIISGLFKDGKVDYEKHPVIYNKDGDIMVQLAGKANADKAYELGASDEITNVKVSNDAKYIFYGDDYEAMSSEFDLYYRKVGDSKGTSAKEIESGVTGYSVAPNGKMVVFKKGDKLYISNLKKSEKIDNDVYSYSITSDGKNIVYLVGDSSGGKGYELYVRKMTLNAKAQEIDDEVSSYYLPENENTGRKEYNGVLYYTKENNLYYVKNAKNPVEVLSDVDSVQYLDDKLFAVTVDEKTVSEENAFTITKDEDGYESREIKPGIRGDYNEKGEFSYKKCEYTIYSVNGKKAKELGTEFTYVNLSGQLARMGKDSAWVIKKDGKLIDLGDVDSDDVSEIYVSEDEKYVYMIEDKEDNPESKYFGTATLNSYKLSAKGLGAKTEIATKVSDMETLEVGAYAVYTRDGEDSVFNVLYNNKFYEEIGENVSVTDSGLCENTIYFLDDCDQSEGALMKYTLGKKEAKKLGDDVREIEVRGDKVVYYLADWDNDDNCGTLYLVKGNGKAKVVDEEVSSIWW